MPYQQVPVTNITDIPAAISAFALANGWAVNNANPAQPIFSHPSKPGSMTFRVRALVSGVNNQNRDIVISDATGLLATNSAVMRSPKLAGSANNPVVPNPNSLQMFTGLFPEPFIAVAVSFGANLYRHIYFGFMDRIGTYTGGEVMSATAGSSAVINSPVSYTATNMFKHLFGGRRVTAIVAKSESGGVRVVHAGNPTPWRVFSSPSTISTPFSSFIGDEAIGGFGDGYNDVMVARAQSSYAGAVVLVPCNILTSRVITGDVRFRPIGNPSGVRLVNMRDLAEGQQITIASEVYRVYPAVSKRSELVMPATALGGNYREFESTFQLGYAYREA